MNATHTVLAVAAMALAACATPDPKPMPTPAAVSVQAPTLADVEAEITRTYFSQLPEWATYYAAGFPSISANQMYGG